MFKHILVPVDGTELSERAIQTSVDLALQLGASITAYVAEPLPPVRTGPRQRSWVVEEALEHEAVAAAHALEVLSRFEACARAAGVEFKGVHDQVPRIGRAIVDVAESSGCDMIVMVTRGRGAFGEFLFGSQTKAVLAGSKLPLLVLH